MIEWHPLNFVSLQCKFLFIHLLKQPHAKSWLFGKDPDAGRDWGQEEKGKTEVEMAGWHHWLDGHEFEWTLGHGDGQGGLACCNSWGHKESDTTERLNWTEFKQYIHMFSEPVEEARIRGDGGMRATSSGVDWLPKSAQFFYLCDFVIGSPLSQLTHEKIVLRI